MKVLKWFWSRPGIGALVGLVLILVLSHLGLVIPFYAVIVLTIVLSIKYFISLMRKTDREVASKWRERREANGR